MQHLCSRFDLVALATLWRPDMPTTRTEATTLLQRVSLLLAHGVRRPMEGFRPIRPSTGLGALPRIDPAIQKPTLFAAARVTATCGRPCLLLGELRAFLPCRERQGPDPSLACVHPRSPMSGRFRCDQGRCSSEVRRRLRRRHDAAREADPTERYRSHGNRRPSFRPARVLELNMANWRIQGFAAITMCAGQLNATVPSHCT